MSLVLLLATGCGTEATDQLAETCPDIRLAAESEGFQRVPTAGWQAGDRVAVVFREQTFSPRRIERVTVEWFSPAGERLDAREIARIEDSQSLVGPVVRQVAAGPEGSWAIDLELDGDERLVLSAAGAAPKSVEIDPELDVRAMGWDAGELVLVQRKGIGELVVERVDPAGERHAAVPIVAGGGIPFFAAGVVYELDGLGQLAGWTPDGVSLGGASLGATRGFRLAATAEGISAAWMDGADLVFRGLTRELAFVGEEGRIAGAFADPELQTEQILADGSWRVFAAAPTGISVHDAGGVRPFVFHDAERCAEVPGCGTSEEVFGVMAFDVAADPWLLVRDPTGGSLGTEADRLVYRAIRADDTCTYRSVFHHLVDG